MENEEQIALDVEEITPQPKTSSKKKWLIFVVLIGLAAWFVNTQTSAVKSPTSYKTIIESASENFYEVFPRVAPESNVNLVIDSEILDDERISIYRNIDLAVSYLNPALKGQDFGIRVFFNTGTLRKDLLKYQEDEYWYSYLLEDLSEDGIFGSGSDCASESSVGITYSDYWEDSYIYILAKCAWEKNSNDEWELLDPDIFSHEIAHVAQDKWFGANSYYYNCYIPKWFSEGQAQFVSSRISSMTGELDPELFRKNWIDFEPNGMMSDDESYSAEYGPYSDGAFAVEYLVGKYGWHKLDKLIENLNIIETSNCNASDVHDRFSAAFKKTYKQSLASFYAEVKPYILWNVEKLN